MTISYTSDQQNVIDEYIKFMLDSTRSVFVIDGRPGCGKTYLIKSLIEKTRDIVQFLSSLLNQDKQLNFVLCATTNQAAEVLAEKTGLPTSTIHSYLGLRVFNDYSTGKTRLTATDAWQVKSNVILFIDESSMVDKYLLKHIDKATINCKVVYILDKNQVLPVFESHIPLLEKHNADVNLKQIVRQATNNSIITYAHELCDAIESKTKNIPAIPHTAEIIHLTPSEFKQELINHFTQPDCDHKYKVLSWSNKQVLKYNSFVRSLNHSDNLIAVGEFLVSNDSYTAGTNDIVFLRNQEEVIVEKASDVLTTKEGIQYQRLQIRAVDKKKSITVNRPVDYTDVSNFLNYYKKDKNWHSYFALKNDMLDLRSIHACTVHKAQGSTYDTVFIDIDDICSNNKIDEVKRLILVAITRASNKVFIRGSIPTKYR